MHNKLSVKIALLMLITGPVFIIAGILIPTIVKQILVHFHIISFTLGLDLIFLALAILVALLFPVTAMSLLLSWYILRSFKRIKTALDSLKYNHYKTTIPFINIQEFDVLINEINTLSQRLQEEEDMRKDLISNTSHELNTPLTAISAQLLGMIEGVIPTTRETLIALHEQSERLNNLTDQLQKYAAIRSKSLRMHYEKIQLKRFVQSVCSMLSFKAKQHNIKIENLISDTTTIYIDKELFGQVLTNLIANAVIHSHGANVTISYKDDILSVSDNGIGIPEDKRMQVFERFYKVSNTEGLGLGLAITKELTDILGWSILFRNNFPGKGVTFEIVCRQTQETS